ncbi:MAG: PKD-like domain-containing protein, partial [Bacteroidota bacterium]
PQISAMSTVVCSGVTFVVSPVNQTNGIVPDGTNYSWNIPSVSSPSLTGGQSGSGLYVTGTLLNFTNTPKSATYQVEPIAPAGSCKGGLFTVTVIVNPGAYITEMSTTVCSGVQFDISPRNGVNGIIPDLTTYNWDVPTLSASLTGGASNSNQPSIFGKLTNSSNVTRTAVYTVVPNVQSCESYSSFTLTVYVNPTPKISAMSTVVCSGLQFEVSPTNGGTEIVPVTTRYAWEIPAVSTASLVGGQSDSGRISITGTLTNNTNTTRTAVYTVTPTSILGECKGATFTVLVTVNPKAVINTMTAVICSGASFVLTPVNQLNGIVPQLTTYKWATPSVTNPSLTGGESRNTAQDSIYGSFYNGTNTVQTATYTVFPTSPNCGVNAPFTVIVTVNPEPQIQVMSIVTCSGVQFTISPTNLVNGIVPLNTAYSWSTPSVSNPSLTGGVSGNAINSFLVTLTNNTNTTQSATYNIKPTAPAPGSCVGANFTVIVYVNPKAVITEMSATVCTGVQFQVTPVDGTNGIVPDFISYSWSKPLVSSASLTGGQSDADKTSIFGTLINATNSTQTAIYTVVPSLSNCADNNAFTVTVFINPRPQINSMSSVTCSGVQFTLSPTDKVNGIVPINTIYTWDPPVVSNASLTGGISGNSVNKITGTLINLTNKLQTATYNIRTIAPAPGSCEGNTFTAIIYVNPQSAITEMSTTICSGIQFRVTPVNETNGIVPFGTTYTWGLPVVGTPSLTGGESISVPQEDIFGTLFNATNRVQTAVYTVVPNTVNCSIGSTFTLTVYVNSTPQISAMSTVVCSGVTFVVSPVNQTNGIVPDGTNYSWN